MKDAMALLDLRQLLELAAPLAPAGLISDAAWSRLRRIPNVLPPAIALGTFECRLDRCDPTDFQICLTQRSGGHRAIAEWLDGLDRSTLLSLPQWQRAIELLQGWTDPGSPLFAHAPAVWFELDMDGSPAAPVPFGFFTITPPWFRGRPTRDVVAATVRYGLNILAGGELAASTAATVERCLSVLPIPACLLHVAVRPRADGDVVRLIVKMPREELPAYLESIGSPAPRKEVEHLLARYGSKTWIHSFQIDVGASVAPRFGMEFYFPAAPLEDARWFTLLARLVSDGACDPERAAMLCAWPAFDLADRPEVLRELLIKVVYEAGQALQAKAYLPFGLAASAFTSRLVHTDPPNAPAA